MEGVPRFGVIKVGEVEKTAEPLPVSSVKAVARLAELNEPNEVALPVLIIAPVKFALVVTVPAVNPGAVPVIFVPIRTEGVPRFGVTKVGEVEKTSEPLPVSSEITPANCEDVVDANCDNGLATLPSNASKVAEISIVGVDPPDDVILFVVPNTDVTPPPPPPPPIKFFQTPFS